MMIREGFKKNYKWVLVILTSESIRKRTIWKHPFICTYLYKIKNIKKSYTMFVWYSTMLKFGSAFIVLHCFLDFVTFSSSETLGLILWAWLHTCDKNVIIDVFCYIPQRKINYKTYIHNFSWETAPKQILKLESYVYKSSR